MSKEHEVIWVNVDMVLSGSRLSVGQVNRYVDWGTSCDLALDVARKVECAGGCEKVVTLVTL